MRKAVLTVLLSLSLSLAAGCTDDVPTTPDPPRFDPALLTGVEWRVDSLWLYVGTGYTYYKPKPDTLYALRFFENGELRGRDVCNACDGSYEASEEGALSILLGCNESACGSLGWYSGYSAFLRRALSYEVSEDRLRIHYEDGFGEVRFIDHYAVPVGE